MREQVVEGMAVRQHVLQGAPDRLVAGRAEEALGGPAERQDAPVPVEEDHRILQVIHHLLER
jgi:hypothetical protein